MMLPPKYIQMYLFIRAKCLAKLCPYIHMNNFPAFTEKGKKNGTSICHPNLFLALVLQLKPIISDWHLEKVETSSFN